jgi:stringent starvation protein A
MHVNDRGFWTTHATLYATADDLEGHRLRLFILEKECPCMIDIVQSNKQLPELLERVNPEHKFPFLVDKMLALWSPDTIESYLEERFPNPSFLPCDTKVRAQIRQAATVFRGWYAVQPHQWLSHAVTQLSELLGASRWICGNEFTLADIAIAPWLWRLPPEVKVPYNVRVYGRRLFSRPSFASSLSNDEVHYGNAFR